MAGIKTVWELHTLPAINSWFYWCNNKGLVWRRNDKYNYPINLFYNHPIKLNQPVPYSTAPMSIQNWLQIGGSWGIVSMLKPLQKQLQRRHKHQCLKIDTLIRRLNGHFIASSVNRQQCAGVIFAFLHYSPAVFPNYYAVFPPHLSV